MIKDYILRLNTYDNLFYVLGFVFLASVLISFFTFKPLLMVIVKRRLHDAPNNRSAHTVSTPTIGGVAIYISFVLVICLFGALLNLNGLLLLVGSLTCLFFLGLNDDLNAINPLKKAFVQLIVATIIVVISDIRILSFFGIFGIGILPYWVSVIFTIFVYLLVINAFNLIDGIDGLAGGLAIVSCAALAMLFWRSHKYSLTALSLSLLGALIPFLRLNLGRKRKIFMGDSGSMLIGFVLAFCVINFLYYSEVDKSIYSNSAPILALSILFYPLLDTFRIFFIRSVINRTSPFKADRNHIHHKFLKLGFSHKKTSLIIVVISCVVFISTYIFKTLHIHLQLVLLLSLGSALFTSVFLYQKKINKKSA